ncbi:uncharacterized protein LOC129759548 [Uranotaenia lowii]|uniref:uncharacterized protein LOC129759548 n=1 Tax=Uranotaenia lowii TaxID=190385 RepID=UPI00247A6A26|nr:uncharacterized protein LOC129759548 [Uranotaenia lowii]
MHGRTGACKFLAVEIANSFILPRDHPITNLIIESYHQKFHHQNHKSVINEVQQKYCISCLRRVYAKVRSNYQRCKLREARPRHPTMADLPKCRLAAFLKQALQDVDRHKLAQEFVSATTTWCFIPPAAPHNGGGSWERLVQSVKRTLDELQLPNRPKEEELRSALVEIEGIINARPLTHAPIEDEAAPALTPNHWLLGSSDGFKPWIELEVNSIALSRGWHLSQQIANHFCKRWLRKYLPEITRRSK